METKDGQVKKVADAFDKVCKLAREAYEKSNQGWGAFDEISQIRDSLNDLGGELVRLIERPAPSPLETL